MKRSNVTLSLASLLLATPMLVAGCMFFPENISDTSDTNSPSPSESESPSTSESSSPEASDSPSPEASDSPSPSSTRTRNGKVEFTLINEINRPMERFFASPSNTDNWEEDIFGDKFVLKPGKKVKITIDDKRKDCIYDFKATLGPSPDGSVGRGDMVQTKINICTLTEWGFKEN
jgi:hypothetical protein